MIRPILTSAHEAVHTVCLAVLEGEDVSQLVRDMFDTMAATPQTHGGLKALGLAANQLGVLKRVVCIDCESNIGKMVLVNPVIVSGHGKAFAQEICFSLPGIAVRVKRYTDIKISANHHQFFGFRRPLSLRGLLARVVQHEVDHLSGLLIDRFLK